MCVFNMLHYITRDQYVYQQDGEKSRFKACPMYKICFGCVPSSDSDNRPFFALRSCHQRLQTDAGEFFSPDYLCSNPPLWCNWTIQVAAGKRVHLHLEDLTPGDSCQFKRDQLHVEDPAAEEGGGHKVLQRCWREATFTSSSNSMEVVLLIGSRPGAPYRGFHGRYQAFGPVAVYNPQEALPNSRQESDLSAGSEEFLWLGPDDGDDEEEDKGGGSEEHLELEFTTPSILDDYIQPSPLLAEQNLNNEVSEKKRLTNYRSTN